MVRPGMDTIGAEGTAGSRGRGVLEPATERSVAIHERPCSDSETGRCIDASSTPPAGRGSSWWATAATTRRLIRRLGDRPWSGPPIVGFVDAGHGRSASLAASHRRHLALHPQTDPVPVLGSIDHLDELVDRARATHVVVAVSGKPGRLGASARSPTYQFRRGRPLGLRRFRPARLGRASPIPRRSRHCTRTKISLRPAVTASLFARDWLDWPRTGQAARRSSSIAAARARLARPLFVVVAIAIWLTSGRPIFYTQERVGQGGACSRSSSSAACAATPRARPGRSGRRTTTRAARGSAIGSGTPTSTSCRSSSTCSRAT